MTGFINQEQQIGPGAYRYNLDHSAYLQKDNKKPISTFIFKYTIERNSRRLKLSPNKLFYYYYFCF